MLKFPIYYEGSLEDFIENYLKRDIIDYKIIKKSIDARSKHEFCYIYEFGVTIKDEEKFIKYIKIKIKTLLNMKKSFIIFLSLVIKL